MGSPEFSPTRREFLKKAGKIAIAVTAAGAASLIVEIEIPKGKDGIVRVKEGNFIPLYELHSVGIKSGTFPQDTDGVFREYNENLSYINGILANHPEYANSILAPKQIETDVDEIILIFPNEMLPWSLVT